jgi:hypothetical protein
LVGGIYGVVFVTDGEKGVFDQEGEEKIFHIERVEFDLVSIGKGIFPPKCWG